MSVFSPGVSSHGPRWASSRTQPRHSCSIQPSSPEEGAVQGSHTPEPRGLRGVCVQWTESWAQYWGWDTVFPAHPATPSAFTLFFLQPGDVFPTSSYACPSTLHLPQGTSMTQNSDFSDASWTVLTPFPPPSPVYPFLLNTTPTCFQGIESWGQPAFDS